MSLETEHRPERLREQADRDPLAARDYAWRLFRELGDRRDDEALATLFRSGRPPRIDGPTEGMLVSTSLGGVPDAVVRAVTSRWMPWLGKRFDREHTRGDNVLARSARVPAKVLWPLYRTRRDPLGRLAFDFETRVEPGRVDPGLDVLAIDYAPIRRNPALIRRVRDELVEVVPGANLGRILWGTPSAGYRCIGWFALRSAP